MNGEAGELADKVKKVIRGDGGVVVKDDSGAIVFTDDKRKGGALEIDDVMWNCAALSYYLGYTLE